MSNNAIGTEQLKSLEMNMQGILNGFDTDEPFSIKRLVYAIFGEDMGNRDPNVDTVIEEKLREWLWLQITDGHHAGRYVRRTSRSAPRIVRLANRKKFFINTSWPPHESEIHEDFPSPKISERGKQLLKRIKARRGVDRTDWIDQEP